MKVLDESAKQFISPIYRQMIKLIKIKCIAFLVMVKVENIGYCEVLSFRFPIPDVYFGAGGVQREFGWVKN